MPLSEDDLRIKLSIDPDTKDMQSALRGIGETADKQAAKQKSAWQELSRAGAKELENLQANQKLLAGLAIAGSVKPIWAGGGTAGDSVSKQTDGWKALGKAGAEQLANIEANRKILEGLADWQAPTVQVDAYAEALKDVNAQLAKQRESLLGLKAATSPESLREQVALQKQLADAKKEYAKAFAAEQQRQGIATSGSSNLFATAGQIGKASLEGFSQGSGGGIGSAVGSGISSGLTESLGTLGVVGAAAAVSIAAVVGAMGALYATMVKTVQLAAPGTFRQFQFALDDSIAIIGKTFIPVMELFTRALRLLGDVFANVLPNTEEMRDALAPLNQAFSELSDYARDLFKEFGPDIRALFVGVLRTSIYEFIGLANLFVAAIVVMTASLRPFIALAEKFGVLPGPGNESSSAAGSTARPAAIESIEAYQTRLQTSAFSIGGAGNPAERTAKATEETASLMASVLAAIKSGTIAALKVVNPVFGAAGEAQQVFQGQQAFR